MPLSGDPSKRSRQLANLRPAPPAPAGNALARKHGGYAQVAADRLDDKQREVYDALAADAPLRDPQTGELPAADAVLVRLLATCLCRLEDVEGHLRDYGWRDQDSGEARSPILELEARLRKEAADYLDALGMTPRGRARLGLDLQRQRDLALEWAAETDREAAGG